MYSFFVLGLIPGTNIQITFQMWLLITAAIAAVYAYWHYLPHPTLRIEIRSPRRPLHASQLHLRAI